LHITQPALSKQITDLEEVHVMIQTDNHTPMCPTVRWKA
jgi:hypothetical protein